MRVLSAVDSLVFQWLISDILVASCPNHALRVSWQLTIFSLHVSGNLLICHRGGEDFCALKSTVIQGFKLITVGLEIWSCTHWAMWAGWKFKVVDKLHSRFLLILCSLSLSRIFELAQKTCSDTLMASTMQRLIVSEILKTVSTGKHHSEDTLTLQEVIVNALDF